MATYVDLAAYAAAMQQRADLTETLIANYGISPVLCASLSTDQLHRLLTIEQGRQGHSV